LFRNTLGFGDLANRLHHNASMRVNLNWITRAIFNRREVLSFAETLKYSRVFPAFPCFTHFLNYLEQVFFIEDIIELQ